MMFYMKNYNLLATLLLLMCNISFASTRINIPSDGRSNILNKGEVVHIIQVDREAIRDGRQSFTYKEISKKEHKKSNHFRSRHR